MDSTAQFVLIAKRLLRELRELSETVSAGFHGVQKQIEAVAKNSQSHENSTNVKDAEPCDVLVSKLTLPKAVEEYYQSHKDERPRGKWGWIKFLMEAGGLIALVVYVIVTSQTLKETKKQAAASQGQLNLMRFGQRPWLGVFGQVVINRPPHFQVIADSVGLEMEGRYVVKNFGTSPAFDENSSISFQLPMADTAITRPPAYRIPCFDYDTRQRKGEVIFPGSGVNQGFTQLVGTTTTIPGKRITEVSHIWLLGCISYNDAESKIHHTKFWLRSVFPPNASWITIDNGVFRYMPILGFESWGEEAD